MAKNASPSPEPQNQTKAPSAISLWLEESMPGWMVPGALILLVVGGGALYIFDMIPEHFAALALAVGVSIGGAGYVARDLASGAKSQLQRLSSTGVAIVVFGLTVTPAFMVIMPGEPLVTASLKASGDKLKLSPGLEGRVRLLVHGRIGGAGEATVSFDIEGGETPITGKLERTQSTQRAGRRGYSTVSHEDNSKFLSGVIPTGVSELTLTRLEGNLNGDLEVRVFRDHWPVAIDALLALIALAAVAFLSARQNVKSSATPIAGLTLGFGFLVEVLATPDVAVRAQIGALILAAIGGSVVGTLFNSLAKRFVPRAS